MQPVIHFEPSFFGAEKLVIGYNQVFDVPYTIVRPSALYGERCVSRRVGQAFIENALSGKDLIVNGDGTDALDFTYINDFLDGWLNLRELDATTPDEKLYPEFDDQLRQAMLAETRLFLRELIVLYPSYLNNYF